MFLKKKILVTGWAWFVWSHLCKEEIVSFLKY